MTVQYCLYIGMGTVIYDLHCAHSCSSCSQFALLELLNKRGYLSLIFSAKITQFPAIPRYLFKRVRKSQIQLFRPFCEIGAQFLRSILSSFIPFLIRPTQLTISPFY